MVNLQEATGFLVANGFMVNVKGVFHLTPSFQRAMKALVSVGPSEFTTTPGTQSGLIKITPNASDVMVVSPTTDWVSQYKQFIVDANVPARCEGKYGDAYDTNKYSEPAMKAFRKAIETGAEYDLLVMATALYYKSGVRMKVAIGRYMEEGRWRSDYDALKSSAETGDVRNHINNVVDNGQYDSTQLG